MAFGFDLGQGAALPGDQPYGAERPGSSSISFHDYASCLRVMKDACKYIAFAGVAAGLGAAIVFQDRLNDYVADVTSASDLANKISISLGMAESSRTQVFSFEGSRTSLNPVLESRLGQMAAYLNGTPALSVRIAPCGATPEDQSRVDYVFNALSEKYQVAFERITKINSVGASCAGGAAYLHNVRVDASLTPLPPSAQ